MCTKGFFSYILSKVVGSLWDVAAKTCSTSPGNNFYDAWKDPFIVAQCSQDLLFNSPTFSGGISHVFSYPRFCWKGEKQTKAVLSSFESKFFSTLNNFLCFPKMLCFETVYIETVLAFLKKSKLKSLNLSFQTKLKFCLGKKILYKKTFKKVTMWHSWVDR